MIIAVGERAHRAPFPWESATWNPTVSVAFCTGATRTRWLGMGGAYVDRCVNLLPPDKMAGAWDVAEAASQAVRVLEWARAHGHVLVAAGRRVERALQRADRAAWGRRNDVHGRPEPRAWGVPWSTVDCVRCVTVPHPSGRGRVLNDDAALRAVRASLAALRRAHGETRFPYAGL